MFRRLRRKLVRLAFVSGSGAAAAYFFDPERGVARRTQLREQVEARLRRRDADAGRKAQHLANVAEGVRAQAQGAGVPQPEDDVEVARAVKQTLAVLDVPTADVTVESVDGVVTLRGQVDNSAEMATVGKAVSETPGVREVRSFLHVPGTPAPNKAASLRAS